MIRSRSDRSIRTARNWDLLTRLPDVLPAALIRASYDCEPTSQTRRYDWNGWEFDVPPGVFLPSTTSRLIHERLLDGTIPVSGAAYATMGVGAGVEAVVAAARGARAVYALDVHEESVRSTARQYARIVGDRGPPLIALVSDLWRELPEGVRVDLVTFNPPFITVPLSDDPDVLRHRCMGLGLARRFFDGLSRRRLLTAAGKAYLTLSNAEPIRDVVAIALRLGFDVEAVHVDDATEGYLETYVLAFADRRA